MSCPNCVDKHHIPEYIFACTCDCHSWAGPATSNIDPSTIAVELYGFTIGELKALSRALETQYLAYDDEELHTVVNKIFKLLKENK